VTALIVKAEVAMDDATAVGEEKARK